MYSRLLRLTAGIAFVSALASASQAQPQARAQAPRPPIAGIYRLVTIDGHALPFSPIHPGAPANVKGPEVLAATIVLKDDGALVLAMAYRFADPSGERFMAQPFSGRYESAGETWSAQWDGAGRTPLTMASDTLVMNNEGMMFGYKKVR